MGSTVARADDPRAPLVAERGRVMKWVRQSTSWRRVLVVASLIVLGIVPVAGTTIPDGWRSESVSGLGGRSTPHAEADVDLELVLAVDVSVSMRPAELLVQRQGYEAAFRRQEVIDAIRSGSLGAIAVAYVEWAGPSDQSLIVPWTILSNAESVHAFADKIVAAPLGPSSNSPPWLMGTSISGLYFFRATCFQKVVRGAFERSSIFLATVRTTTGQRSTAHDDK